MIERAQKEADDIIAGAEEGHLQKSGRGQMRQRIRQEAEDEARKLTEEAHRNADSILHEAESRAESVRKAAYDEGYENGRVAGYDSGKAEVSRLVNQLHNIDRAIEKRNEIIDESETQIINLVLHSEEGSKGYFRKPEKRCYKQCDTGTAKTQIKG